MDAGGIAGLLEVHPEIDEVTEHLHVALGLILGGTLSNVGDRLLHGWVIDYLDFRFWPVFNVADTVINIGIFLIILNMLRRK